MRARSDLYAYQRTVIERMVGTHQLAVFLDPGLGKTASTLTALHDLKVPSTLIVAPAKVVEMEVWQREALNWGHLSKYKVIGVLGTPSQRLHALATPARAYVISYANLRWLTEHSTLDFDAVVFDELSRLKHPGSLQFKTMRYRLGHVPRRYGLTGSPIGNHLRDLWGELYAVALDKPLGTSKVQFDYQYFYTVPLGKTGACVYKPRPEAETEIFKRIRPWVYTLDTEDVPKWFIRINRIKVPLPPSTKALVDKLRKELEIELASGKHILALASSALALKIQQLNSGALYTDSEGSWEEVHTAKTDALEALVEELDGEPLIVYYWFKNEAERLRKRFPKARTLQSAKDYADWNDRRIPILLAQPASTGLGLNLQHGGHHLAWYTLPWSYEIFKQANARLTRPGQRSPYVVIHMLTGELDGRVEDALRNKASTEQRLMAGYSYLE